jgi:hypothetical protein
LTANSTELQQLRDRPPLFSFQNKSSLADIDQKKADIKAVVTATYSDIQLLYGKPYLLHSITITFVDNFTIAGASGEIQITNSNQGVSIDIHLKDFDKNNPDDVQTIRHEMIHGFHGVAVLNSSAQEEGITVATTDAVFNAMVQSGKLANTPPYVGITEAQYQSYNSTYFVYLDNDKFYKDPNVSRVYQMIGYAWYKLYKQDKDFFKKFNDIYYARVQKGQKVDPAGVRDIIASIIPSVDGVPIATYLQTNRAFNPN